MLTGFSGWCGTTGGALGASPSIGGYNWYYAKFGLFGPKVLMFTSDSLASQMLGATQPTAQVVGSVNQGWAWHTLFCEGRRLWGFAYAPTSLGSSLQRRAPSSVADGFTGRKVQKIPCTRQLPPLCATVPLVKDSSGSWVVRPMCRSL